MDVVSVGDWAQVVGATFTALAAFAALATVVRAEHDRRDRQLPDLHIEVVQDLAASQVRAYVVNYGGPAREVTIAGVLGGHGFAGQLGPTTYWRPGESRTVILGMPVDTEATVAHVMVEGRDVRKRYLFAATVGGATYRWPLRQAKKLSRDLVFRLLFPEVGSPLDVRSSVTKSSSEHGEIMSQSPVARASVLGRERGSRPARATDASQRCGRRTARR